MLVQDVVGGVAPDSQTFTRLDGGGGQSALASANVLPFSQGSLLGGLHFFRLGRFSQLPQGSQGSEF